MHTQRNRDSRLNIVLCLPTCRAEVAVAVAIATAISIALRPLEQRFQYAFNSPGDTGNCCEPGITRCGPTGHDHKPNRTESLDCSFLPVVVLQLINDNDVGFETNLLQANRL